MSNGQVTGYFDHLVIRLAGWYTLWSVTLDEMKLKRGFTEWKDLRKKCCANLLR